jgi:RNA polymerase sigma-70 factor (ECF subfamily)
MCDVQASTGIGDSPDSLLVMSARNGDHEAFVVLLKHCLPGVSRTIRRITKNSADAEDVLQDATLRAYINLSSFRGACSFSGWFQRIAINSALMHLRKRHRRLEASIDVPHDEVTSLRMELPDRAATPEAAYLEKEKLSRIREAVRRMRTRDRSLMEMRYRGSSIQEIAGTVGLSVAAVKSRLFRSKMLLSKEI